MKLQNLFYFIAFYCLVSAVIAYGTKTAMFSEFDSFMAQNNFDVNSPNVMTLVQSRYEKLRQLAATDTLAALEYVDSESTSKLMGTFKTILSPNSKLQNYLENEESSMWDFMLICATPRLDINSGRESDWCYRTITKSLKQTNDNSENNGVQTIEYKAYLTPNHPLMERSSLFNIPLHIVAIGDIAIVRPSPVMLTRCQDEAPYGLHVGSEIKCFTSEQEQIQQQKVLSERLWLLDDDGRNVEPSQPSQLGACASQVPKKKNGATLMWFMVDFPDQPGIVDRNNNPIPDSNFQNTMNSLYYYFLNTSYGQFSIDKTFQRSPTIRMSFPTTALTSGEKTVSNIKDEVRAAALKLTPPINYCDYDFDIYFWCRGLFPWAGLAYVGARVIWLSAYYDPTTVGHEMGHNFGLNHAHYWVPSNPLVPLYNNGTIDEYGDPFDIMGSRGDFPNQQYSLSYKTRILSWVNSTKVNYINGSQPLPINSEYIIYPHDQQLAVGYNVGIAILRPYFNFILPSGGVKYGQTYWVSYRTRIQNNQFIRNGLMINMATNGEQSVLLDMNPSNTDRKDAPLPLGKTYSDCFGSKLAIHITPKSLVSCPGLPPSTTPFQCVKTVVNTGVYVANLQLKVCPQQRIVNILETAKLDVVASDNDAKEVLVSWKSEDTTRGGSFAGLTGQLTFTPNVTGIYQIQLFITNYRGTTLRRTVHFGVRTIDKIAPSFATAISPNAPVNANTVTSATMRVPPTILTAPSPFYTFVFVFRFSSCLSNFDILTTLLYQDFRIYGICQSTNLYQYYAINFKTVDGRNVNAGGKYLYENAIAGDVHLALVFSKTTASLYVNGTLYTTVSSVTPLSYHHNATLFFGSVNNRPTNITIKRFVVYNFPLSPIQIANDMTKKTTGNGLYPIANMDVTERTTCTSSQIINSDTCAGEPTGAEENTETNERSSSISKQTVAVSVGVSVAIVFLAASIGFFFICRKTSKPKTENTELQVALMK